MFEESLLESAHLLRTQNRWPAVAAIALQATAAAVLLAIPIVHPEFVRLHAPRLEFSAPAPTPPKPPPPIQHVTLEANTSTAPSVPTSESASQATRGIPTLDPNHFGDAPPTLGSSMNMASNGNNFDVALISVATGSPHVVMASPEKVGPARVSQGVSAGLLLAPILPVYPPIARTAHQEGTVTIHAIISKEGRIESANAITGPTMLQGAALDAVRSARYRPYRLNGEPTEVDTIFSIIFRLGS